jgi:hypothetical protein
MNRPATPDLIAAMKSTIHQVTWAKQLLSLQPITIYIPSLNSEKFKEKALKDKLRLS